MLFCPTTKMYAIATLHPPINTISHIDFSTTVSFHVLLNHLLPPSSLCLLRGESAVCIPSPAGESLQLPRTLFPPTAHHCCLSGTLSIHDDKVNTLPFSSALLPYIYAELEQLVDFFFLICST